MIDLFLWIFFGIIFIVHCLVMYGMGLKWWAAISCAISIWGAIALIWFGFVFLFA
jgi:hypothetical protein